MQTSQHTQTLARPVSAAQFALAVMAGAALTTVFAQIRVPLGFTPVPVTLQTLAVVVTGMLLGRRIGPASLGLYVAAGLAGLPVFSGWTGGVAPGGALLPTLGYLLAFPLGAWVAGSLWDPARSSGPFSAVAAACTGMAVIHTGGFLWLTALAAASAASPAAAALYALKAGAVPFVLVDLAKATAAAAIANSSKGTLVTRLGGLRG